MKHILWGKGLIALALILVLSSIGVHKLCQAIFSITDAHWYFDERFSDLGQKSIIRFGHDCCQNNFSLFVEQLKKQFPVIKDVTLCHNSSGVMNVTVESIVPKARVDDAWVVSEEGIVVNAYFFQASLLASLPLVATYNGKKKATSTKQLDCPECPQKKSGCCELDPLFTAWIVKTARPLLTTYQVIWIDQFHIRLQDPEQQSFFLQLAVETELKDYIFDAAAKIKQSLRDRGNFLRTAYDWIADLRFRDHVIIFREQRGMKHGTNTG